MVNHEILMAGEVIDKRTSTGEGGNKRGRRKEPSFFHLVIDYRLIKDVKMKKSCV